VEHLRNDLAGMDARCPNNFLDESSDHQATQGILSLIRLLEVAQRWQSQRSSVVHTSDLNFLQIMLHTFESDWHL
jgi:hypothetical protein